jgi:hypothetical protein
MVRLGIIDPAQSGSLFSNLHLLKGVNESLLAALEKHDAGQSSMGIGAIFSEVVRSCPPPPPDGSFHWGACRPGWTQYALLTSPVVCVVCRVRRVWRVHA